MQQPSKPTPPILKVAGWGFLAIFAWCCFAAYQQHQRNLESQRQAEQAAQFLLQLGAQAGNADYGAAVRRELQAPDNGYRTVLDTPQGMSSVPSGVTIGPNGEKYYHYDRVTPPQ